MDTVKKRLKHGKKAIVYQGLDAKCQRQAGSEVVVTTCPIGPVERLRMEVDGQTGLSPRDVCLFPPEQ